MKIAAIYARVSSQHQQQRENIESQVDGLEKYAQEFDYQISPQHIYKDDGYSGSTLDRPELDRLRDTVARGELETVLILSPDRLARQFAYQYIITEEFEKAGCTIIFITQAFGNSPAERMLLEMTGVFAEYERTQILERCRRGRLFRARQGEIFLTQPPYGYSHLRATENCPSKLVINEAEAEVVRLIFSWLVDEQISTYQITKRLNESTISTRHGKSRWAAGYIINLLRNQVYCGMFYYNKKKKVKAKRKNISAKSTKGQKTTSIWRPQSEWILIKVPAIISEETWQLARKQLQVNKERAPRNNKKHNYLLKGLLVCEYCQLRMIGHSGTARKRRYLCTRKESLRVHPEVCPGRTILADMLEQVVWENINSIIANPSLLKEQFQLLNQENYNSLEQQEIARIERKISALKSEQQRLIDAYQASVIELEDLRARSGRIAEERARLENRLVTLNQNLQAQQNKETILASLDEFCCSINLALENPTFETKQRILRLVVDKISVTDSQITIKHIVPISDVLLQRCHQRGKKQR